jgi:hypothetical protein
MTIDGKKKPRKSGWIWTTVVIAGVIVSVPLLIQDRGGTRLLAHAQRLGVGLGNYQWLSDREILYTEIWRTAKPHNRVVKRNVDTGIVSLIRSFESNQRNFAAGEMESALSPDRKALIWIGSNYEVLPLGSSSQDTFPHVTSQSLNGKSAYLPSVAWLPNSQGWVEINGAIGASSLIVHPGNGAISISVPLPPGLGMQRILGVTPKNEALISRQRGAVVDEFLAVNLAASPPTVKNLQFTVPPYADVEEIVLSPQGNRLAWKTNTWNDLRSALSGMMSGLMGKGQRGSTKSYALWVSGLDGSGMRRLGYELVPASDGSLEHVRWLPDGKSVSFVYKNGFYTIPAE